MSRNSCSCRVFKIENHHAVGKIENSKNELNSDVGQRISARHLQHFLFSSFSSLTPMFQLWRSQKDNDSLTD